MVLIGLGHKARQGKNCAAVAMVSAGPLDCHARIYAYADALRAEVKRAICSAGGLKQLIAIGGLPCDPCCEHLEYQPRCVNFPPWVKADIGKPRTLLQFWGTDYRRAQDPDYWVKRLRATLDRDNPDVAIITDVRFLNEAEEIHRQGGYLVKVTRTTEPDIAVPAHPSEQALDGYTGWDYCIEAATIRECHLQAAAIYHKITGE